MSVRGQLQVYGGVLAGLLLMWWLVAGNAPPMESDLGGPGAVTTVERTSCTDPADAARVSATGYATLQFPPACRATRPAR